MLRFKIHALIVLLACGALRAADWQATGAAGFGVYHYLTFQSPAGTAQAGIGPRYALDAAVGRAFGPHFALEGAWTFQDGDFEIASGGQKTAFDANTHAVHGDLLYYFRRRSARLRPYLAAGAGVKMYHGIEVVRPRPLAQFGSFADGIDARPLITFGGGVEWSIAHHWGLRVDVRDFTTPFPTSVIIPAAGSNLGGWLHDLVATVGIQVR